MQSAFQAGASGAWAWAAQDSALERGDRAILVPQQRLGERMFQQSEQGNRLEAAKGGIGG
jgi:hypothetical protein